MRASSLLFPFLISSVASSLGAQQTHKAPAPHASAASHSVVEPDGPTVVIDTSEGRFTCKLYAKQAPETTATFVALAKGTQDWTDGAGAAQHGKPFYDGLAMFAVSDGVASGDRASIGMGTAGPDHAPEKTGLEFDRAGRLAALTPGGKQNAGFAITDHADTEWGRRGIVFGQCDATSAELSEKMSHELLSTDNRPKHPVMLRRVAVVEAGQPLPDPAPPIENEDKLEIPPLPPPTIPAPEPTGPTVTIDTTLGTMTCRLFDKEAPNGVANFVGLATGTKPFRSPATHAQVAGKHYYDGLTFGRVIPDFMVQNADMPGDPQGGGDIGFKFGNEIVPGLTFDRPGRLAYANAGPNTNASEFFVTEHPIHRLDGNFTIFGQCDDASVKVVEAIARVPRDEHNKPLTPVVIKKVTIDAAR